MSVETRLDKLERKVDDALCEYLSGSLANTVFRLNEKARETDKEIKRLKSMVAGKTEEEVKSYRTEKDDLVKVIRSLMLSDNLGDVHEAMDRLCDIAGIHRRYGNYLDGWTHEDLESVGICD